MYNIRYNGGQYLFDYYHVEDNVKNHTSLIWAFASADVHCLAPNAAKVLFKRLMQRYAKTK